MTADDAGRLTFTVDLGPSHTEDQFSPQARIEEAAGDAYFTTTAVTIAARAATPDPASGDPDPTDAGGPLPAAGWGAVVFALCLLAVAGITRERVEGPGSSRRPLR